MRHRLALYLSTIAFSTPIACTTMPGPVSSRPVGVGAAELGARLGRVASSDGTYRATVAASARIGFADRMDFGVEFYPMGARIDTRLALAKTSSFDVALIPSAGGALRIESVGSSGFFSPFSGSKEVLVGSADAALRLAFGLRFEEVVVIIGSAGFGGAIHGHAGDEQPDSSLFWTVAGALEVRPWAGLALVPDAYYAADFVGTRRGARTGLTARRSGPGLSSWGGGVSVRFDM